MQNQSSQWLNVRRDRPDWIYHVGLGRDEPDCGQGSGQDQLSDGQLHRHLVVGRRGRCARLPATQPRAICRSTSIGSGPNFPIIKDIQKHVVDKGKSQTAKDKVGENFYNRGVLNSVIIAEAIRNAQKITGKKVITGEDMRRGLETLNITEARLKEIGAEGFARTDESRVRRPQRPPLGLYAAVGRHQVDEGV